MTKEELAGLPAKVDVEYNSCGSTSKTRLMFRTEEAARTAKVGHHFTA